MDKFLEIMKNEHNIWAILIKIGITILVTLICATIARKIWNKRESGSKKIYHKFLYNIILIVIYVFGIVTAVSQIPAVSNAFTALLAGSGVAALAIGLAAQEALGNFINGVVISVSKPFEVGDRIHLIDGNITGYVEDITLRHTVIRTFMNSRIIIPNSTMNKDMIENSDYEGAMASAFVDVTITFDSDMDKAKELISKAIGEHPDYLDIRTEKEKREHKPKVEVFVRDLSINGVNLRASMWTVSIDNNFKACSEARDTIKKEFDKHGILLAQIPMRPNHAELMEEE